MKQAPAILVLTLASSLVTANTQAALFEGSYTLNGGEVLAFLAKEPSKATTTPSSSMTSSARRPSTVLRRL